jgi:O-antigen/teichoic acid export membrane protein
MIIKRLQALFKGELQKNLLTFVSGNFLAVIISSISMLVLPKLLSIEDYGMYKTFTLYLSYTSLLHFGLKDGIYLIQCQNNKEETYRDNIYYSWFTTQQIFISIAIIVFAFIFRSQQFFIILLATTTFFFILNTYFDSYSQAYQYFKVPVKFRLIKESLFLVMLSGIFFLLKTGNSIPIPINYKTLLILNLSVVILLWGLYTIHFRNNLKFSTKNFFNHFELLKRAYKRGSKILVGNFAHQFNANLDKLLVSFFYMKEDFAIYSFGAMFFMLLNLVSTNISQVLLPYLYKQDNNNANLKYAKISIINSYVGLIIFPLLLVVILLIPLFYPNYVESIKIVTLLSLGMYFNIQITMSQNNLLKLKVKDYLYIRNNLISVGLLLLFGIIIAAYKLPAYEFALAASLSILIKYILNDIYISKKVKYKKKIQHLLITYGLPITMFILINLITIFS